MMNQNRKRKSSKISNSAPQKPNNSPKMDFEKSKSCSNLLNTLMNHPVNFMFNQPVDPVQFQIPNYFIIICCPMDLGTVQKKLIEKKYENVGQFCDDVRLTFQNAMVFSRPGNRMHDMAKELNNIFEKGWKSLEQKWKPNLGLGNPNVGMIGCSLGRGDEKRKRENPNVRDGNPNVKRESPNLKRDNTYLGMNGSTTLKRENPDLVNGSSNLARQNPKVGNENPNPYANRELRRAILMKRFAGTILKAQETLLLNQGKRVDPADLKLEREKLERAPLEAEARIRREEEARIEAAQKSVREKIGRERAAARLKLEQMEKVAEIDDAVLEKYSQLASNFNMEEIGLYKKCDEYYGTYEELEEAKWKHWIQCAA